MNKNNMQKMRDCKIPNIISRKALACQFPKDEKHLYCILTFLNLDIFNRILKAINHTANNSANYLKKLSIIFDEQHFNKINKIVKKILTNKDTSSDLKQIDKIFQKIYQLHD